MHTHTYKVIFLSWWKFQSSRSRTMRSEHHLKIPQLWRIPAVKNIPTSQKKAWDTRIYSTRVIFTFVDYPHVFVHLFLRNTAFLLRQHTGWVWTNEVELGIWQNIDLKAMRSEPLKTKLKTLHFLRVDTCKYQLWTAVTFFFRRLNAISTYEPHKSLSVFRAEGTTNFLRYKGFKQLLDRKIWQFVASR